MSQLILTAVGGDLTETVSLNGTPDLTLGHGDLLIAVEAAPVNNADMLFAAGLRPGRAPALAGEGAEPRLAAFTGSGGGGSGGSGDGVTRTALRRLR
jgi:NADPH:quinone reductase-like Zn-dependent oxidoreductase